MSVPFVNRILRCIVGALILAGQPAAAQTALAVHGLTTEYRANPLGIDAPRPLLSWKIVSPRGGAMQSACQVQVWDAGVDGTLESGRPLRQAEGVRRVEQQGKDVVLEVSSGSYKFLVRGGS